MYQIEKILARFNPATGEISGATPVKRHLSDLRGCFADAAEFEAALAKSNPLIYTVTSFEPGSNDGDLHCGIGLIMPGLVGNEYFMTKGHLHSWREAAEFYIGLSGEGMMLLEDEGTGQSRMAPLRPNHVVYVPGKTAHRTMNTGAAPLTYLGVYPAKAGHDYSTIAAGNFRDVVVQRDGRPVLVSRANLFPATVGH
jgi:glucose-6-phosphate isomerase